MYLVTRSMCHMHRKSSARFGAVDLVYQRSHLCGRVPTHCRKVPKTVSVFLLQRSSGPASWALLNIHSRDQPVLHAIDMPHILLGADASGQVSNHYTALHVNAPRLDYVDALQWDLGINDLPLARPVVPASFTAEDVTPFLTVGPFNIGTHQRDGCVDIACVEGLIGTLKKGFKLCSHGELLAHPLRAKFAFEFPGVAIRIQRLTDPMERVQCDLGEPPADWRPIGMGTHLNDVLSAGTADQFVAAAVQWIDPRNPPGLNRGVPHAERCAVHVERPVRVRGTIRTPRHNPNILHRASFEYPFKVNLTCDVVGGHVHYIMPDIQIPASDQPSVDIRRFGNFGRAAMSRQHGVKLRLLFASDCRHRQISLFTAFACT